MTAAVTRADVGTTDSDPTLPVGTDWLYRPRGHVRHIVDPRDGASFCGLWITDPAEWRGTGSQDEYEHRANLRPCHRCVRVLAGPSDGLLPSAERHGLRSTYVDHGCHCDRCRKANTDYSRVNAAKRRARAHGDAPHGTNSGYMNWQCRCDPCKQAGSAHNARQRERRRAARHDHH